MPITLNPSDKGSSVTLSNNNMTAQITSRSNGLVRATEGKTSGKWYWEVTMDSIVTATVAVGIATSSQPLSEGAIGITTPSNGACSHSTNLLGGDLGGSNVAGHTNLSVTGNIVGVLLDLDNKTLKFRRGGSYILDLVIGISNISDTVFPALGATYVSTDVTATVNFGATMFKYPIPYEYSAFESSMISHRRERNSLTNLQVGDTIMCEYTATAGTAGTFANLGAITKTEIPLASTNAPDGSFNFVCVNRNSGKGGILVSDRIIQHTVSWATLNTAGFIDGKIFGTTPQYIIRSLSGGICPGDAYASKVSPILTSDSVPSSYASSASSVYLNDSATYGAWMAFNGKVPPSTNTGWVSATGSTTGWIQIDLGSASLVDVYQVQSDSTLAYNPKNWTFEGSNNGTDWTILDARKDISFGATTRSIPFFFRNSTPYRYYRLNISANNGNASNVKVGQLTLFNTATMKVSPWSLSSDRGFGAFPDTNEWDAYILRSTLNGKITSGDDNIWHFTTPAYGSFTRDTYNKALQTSGNRVVRGSDGSNLNCVQGINYFATTNAAASYGFRPVLEFAEDGTIYY